MHRTKSGRFAKGSSHRRRSTALARTSTRTVYRTARHHRRRGRRHGGGVNMLHLALAAAGLSYAYRQSDSLKVLASKVPGAATFGGPAALGLACLAVDKFAYHNKWLKLAGYSAIVLAGMKFGEQGQDFKWLGDVGDDATINLEGEDVDLEGDEDEIGDDRNW